MMMADTQDGDGAVSGETRAIRQYVCPAREQLFLMPVSMLEWIEPGHLAWFVLDVVAELDTDALHSRSRGCAGRPPYLPEMMCAVLLYAYCCGIRSSRRIESSCQTDAAFRVICGGVVPDHATIARFVVDHEQALAGLFVDGLRLCAAAGLADLDVVALDGTKIAADASLDRNRDAGWIRREIIQLLAVTAQDQRPGQDRLLGAVEPPVVASGRAGRLHAALRHVEAETTAATERAARSTEKATATAERGHRQNGRWPKDPAAALARAEREHATAVTHLQDLTVERDRRAAAIAKGETISRRTHPRLRFDRAHAGLQRAQARLTTARAAPQTAQRSEHRANITDPESRVMNTKTGWVQGYNAQAIVNQHQIVLACEVSQNSSDNALYRPMIDTLTTTLTAAGITDPVQLVLADAGYCSNQNLTAPGPDRLIATTKDHKQRAKARELGQTNGPPPDSTPIAEMEHLLRTPQGAAAYKQRSSLIEPVFGNHKHNHGLRTFRRRGLDAVRSEWAFANLAGNMLKLYHHTALAAT